jgi:methionyl-tRNA formyltransferase
MTVRVAFLGNDPWSVPPLEAIAGDPELELVVVVTNPPKPAGRGSTPRPTAVADSALRMGVPVVQSEGVSVGPGFEGLVEARPDVVVVVAYGHLLLPDVLRLAPLGAVNLHFSLLPRWRGASPVQHALLAGDPGTGVTIIRMDEGLDTGPILGQREVPIRPDDDAGALGGRLADLGGALLAQVLRRLRDGGLPEREQPEEGVTWAGRLGPDERRLRWDEEPAAIVRRVRALSPEPAAVTSFRGQPLKIFGAGVVHDAGAEVPAGTIVTADDRGVLVACGSRGVRLLEVAPAGRRRMGASEWARGARFEPGERLG